MFDQTLVIEQVRELVASIRDAGINLRKVVLFGSYARNEQTEHSDIDVALVADEFIGIGFEDTQLFSKIMIKYPRLSIQPHTFNTKDFNAKKDPFVEEILRTGIEITA